MIGKGYEVRGLSHDVFLIWGKWPGSGAPANGLYPQAKRPDGGAVCKGLTLTRTGVGLYTVQIQSVSNVVQSVPFILHSAFKVVSATQAWAVQTLTENAVTGQLTLKFTVGGAATDPAAAETIEAEVTVSTAGQP